MDRLNQIVLFLVISAGLWLAASEAKQFLKKAPESTPVPVSPDKKPDAPKPIPTPPKPKPDGKPLPAKPKKVIKVDTRQDFLKWVAKENTFFVWSAQWCMACRQKKDAGWWERLQRDNQDIQVLYCDFDKLQNEARQKGIRVLPSVMMNNKKAAVESHVTYPMLLDWSRRYQQ